MLCKNFGHADLYHRCKNARCEVLTPMFQRIQVYSDMTLCWRTSKLNVEEFRYKLGVAQRVPGS